MHNPPAQPADNPTASRPVAARPPVETSLASTIAVLVVPSRSPLALVPLWAVLCGACMAYARGTQAPHSPQVLLALVLAVAIVGVLWSTWRALLVDVDWAARFRRHPLPAPRLLSGLPYTTPWSPLGRLVTRAGQLRRWSQDVPLEIGAARYTLLVLPALILVLSALAGWPLLLLSLAALSLSLLERRAAQAGQAHAALRAGMQVGLGWLAGHVTLAPLTWTAVTLACCYAIAYQGALGLAARADTRTWRALPWLYGGQVAAIGLLALLDRPLTAAFAAFLLAPQWLLLVALGRARAQDSAHARYLQRALPFYLLATLAAAWAPG